MYFQMDAMQAQQQQQADGNIAITATTNVPHPTACTTTTTTSTHTFAQNFSTGSATAQNGDISFDMSWLDVPFWMDQSTNTNDTVTVSNTTTNNNGIIATTTTAFHGGGGGAAVERLPSHNALPQTSTLLDSTRSAPQQPFPVCQQSMLYADNAHLAMVNTLPLHPLQSSTPYVKQEQPQQQQRTQSYWFTNSSGNRAYQPATLMTSAVSMVDTPSIFDDNGLFSTSQTQAQPQQPQQQHPQKPISVYTQSHKHHHHQQFGNTGPMGIQQEQQQQQQQQQHIQLQQGQQEPSTQPSFSPVSPYTTTSSVESLVVKSSVSEPLVAYPEIYGNNKSEARKRNKSMSWLESQSTQAAALPGPDYTHSKAPPIDWHHIQNDPDAMPRPQKPRYQKDDYSPKWVRYSGHLKEGYCDTCVPGKWLQLKNSAYWYHKQFFHGISSVSGQHFAEPLEQRIGENDVVEGLCHQCGQFVPVCNGRRKNNLLWYRHAHKCHIYDRPAKYNGSSPSTTQKQPIYPAGKH